MLTIFAAPVRADETCVPAGRWSAPAERGASVVAPEKLFNDLARQRVVLLGETHDDADHHRWQLHTLAALHVLHPNLAIGLEMFPRRAQGALDAWVAGEITEAEFLERSQWRSVWGQDPALYMPIFEFARMLGVRLIALNVDRALVRKVGELGWAQVPLAEREGVSDPAPATDAYKAMLSDAFKQHAREPSAATDPAFQRFVESMLLWDRAMAQGIADTLRREPETLLVGIMGSGHLQDGYGVARQLADLGERDVTVLLPWDAATSCATMRSGLADALFGIAPRPEAPKAERPRLGVMLDQSESGVRVQSVIAGSIAQRAGLQKDDVIENIAGQRVTASEDVIRAVERQAPGTWLPLVVRRGAQTVELVARFPPPMQ